MSDDLPLYRVDADWRRPRGFVDEWSLFLWSRNPDEPHWRPVWARGQEFVGTRDEARAQARSIIEEARTADRLRAERSFKVDDNPSPRVKLPAPARGSLRCRLGFHLYGTDSRCERCGLLAHWSTKGPDPTPGKPSS